MLIADIKRNFFGQITGLKLGDYLPSMVGSVQEVIYNNVFIGTIEESFAMWFAGKVIYNDQTKVIRVDPAIKNHSEAKQYLKEQILFNYLEMANTQTLFLDDTEFFKIIVGDYENKYNTKYKGWSNDDKFRRYYRSNIFDYDEKYPELVEEYDKLKQRGISFKDYAQAI